jgi:hypothetical protein
MAKKSVAGSDHDSTFKALCDVLRVHADGLTVTADTSQRFCLEAEPGPATLAAWGGAVRRKMIPVAWVEKRAHDVGFHLIGLNGNTALVGALSSALRARLHGKTCFNFRNPEPALLAELGDVTAASIAGLRRAGFVRD